ncbi:hypothetical protein Lal_00015053 [Lupinus albus]|nr:hypothetical protein Lal_00015053 [Lupinus albus]
MAGQINPNLLLAVPLAPLAGSAIAGLLGTKFFGNVVGRTVSHTATILGVFIAMVISIMTLNQVIDGATYNGDLYTWMTIGTMKMSVGFKIDALSAMMMCVVTRRLQPLLLVHLAVHVLDADAGHVQQLPAAVLRLGSGGPGLVPADRLLVHASDRDLREHEGVPREPRRRLRLHPRHRPAAGRHRHDELRRDVRAIGAPGRPDRARHRLAAADGRLHLPVHRRDGQVGAVPAARVAAGLDGRPDPDLGTDPRRDDGYRRHLHGVAHVAAVRTVGYGTVVHRRHRLDHRAVHGLPGHHPERHQARRRIFHAVAAGLHDRRAGRVGV